MTTDTKAVALYPDVCPMQLDTDGNYYCRHVGAMTDEDLHRKSDIAKQLGWRDREIDTLRAALAASRAEAEGLKKDAERYRWLREQKRPEHLASERYIAVAVHDWTANLNPGRVGVNTWGNATVSDEVLDRIVDAAMENGNV